MKYALISEKQIKQVQDALGQAFCKEEKKKNIKAFCIIQSLKPSDPFGYVNEQATSDSTVWIDSDNKHAYTKPLFALEQSK